jgi:hypothetical protein
LSVQGSIYCFLLNSQYIRDFGSAFIEKFFDIYDYFQEKLSVISVKRVFVILRKINSYIYFLSAQFLAELKKRLKIGKTSENYRKCWKWNIIHGQDRRPFGGQSLFAYQKLHKSYKTQHFVNFDSKLRGNGRSSQKNHFRFTRKSSVLY